MRNFVSFFFVISVLLLHNRINAQTSALPFGGDIVVEECTSNNFQLWEYKKPFIVAADTNFCLTMASSNTSEVGSHLYLWKCDALSKQQQWVYEKGFIFNENNLYLTYITDKTVILSFLAGESLPKSSQMWSLDTDGHLKIKVAETSHNLCLSTLPLYKPNPFRTHPLVIGHRGTTTAMPENTMPAFKYACEQLSDGFETDLWRTKDNQVALLHDGTLDRTTNCSGHVSDYTLVELQTKCDACKKFDPKLSCGVPSFDEALALAKKYSVFIVLDLKDSSALDLIISSIKKYKMESHVLASCRTDDQSSKIAQELPSVSRHRLLSSQPSIHDDNFWQNEVTKGIRGYSINHSHLKYSFIAEAHKNFFSVISWTDDTPNVIYEGLNYGIDGYITDSPALVLQLILRARKMFPSK